MRSLRAAAGTVLVLASVVAGCADSSEPAGVSSTTMDTPDASRPGPTEPPSTDARMPSSEPRIEPGPDGTLPDRYPLTASGKVTRAPDGGCLLLVTGSAEFELRGPAAALPEPGTTATVIGEVRRDLDRHCGRLPLVVDSETATTNPDAPNATGDPRASRRRPPFG